VVRDARRQVQHVARHQQPALLRLERLYLLEFEPGSGVLRLRGGMDVPAAHAFHLQQEHVIGIYVRAYRAAVGGVAHHDVVDAPIGDEAERL
jgi:hypothetical protein